MQGSAIELDQVWKKFKKGESYDSLRDLIPAISNGILGRHPREGLQKREFWALKDISVDIKHGDALGIIGPNGAGKSTILKLLSGIMRPTQGRIQVNGRLSALIEVGAGFHPDLTGKENIYLNGTILGMKKPEIDKKLDDIIAFSGLEDFIDTPVKRYSSGMYARLGFSVIAHLDTEILMVDEVLAVGDMSFQKKCLGKMGDLSGSGRTVVFVSHNLAALQNLCTRAIVLNKGGLVFSGTASEAVAYYIRSQTPQRADGAAHIFDLSHAQRRSGRDQGILQRLELLTDDKQPVAAPLPMGASLKVKVHFRLERPTAGFEVGLGFNNIHEQRIFTVHTSFDPDRPWSECVGDNVIQCEIPALNLVPGEYKIKVSFAIGSEECDAVEDAARFTIVESDFFGTGRTPKTGICLVRHHWRMV